MWKQIALVALVLCLGVAVRADPLSDLHELAASAPKLSDLDQLDRIIDAAHPIAQAAAPTNVAADTSFIASESVVSHLSGQDSELKELGELSHELSEKKHAVELQRSAIDADEGKLARLQRIIAENKEILVRNEQALAKSSTQYLGAVKKYTSKVNQAVVESLQATQDAARAQVDSIVGKAPKRAAKKRAPRREAPARSMIAVDATADASAAVHAAQMAEARLSAEHAEQFARLVAMKATMMNHEYARDLAAHKASIPKTHQNDFAAFTANLNLDKESEAKRSDALRAAMHVEHKPEPVAAKPTPVVSEAFDVSQVAKVRAEMAGEPVTMFIQLDESMYVDALREPIPGSEVSTKGLVKPKIEKGVIGLPEPLPVAKPDLSKLPACPPGTPDAPKTPSTPVVPVAPATNTQVDGPYVAPASLIEESSEDSTEAETEEDALVEEDSETDF